MNKYELALVVSAKVEDEVRDAVVEKAKGYITRYNGTITEVEEWGKKKLAYEIQKMHEGFYYFIQFEADAQCPAEVERHVRIMDFTGNLSEMSWRRSGCLYTAVHVWNGA